MKQVQAELGGRPFANDDLLTLQQELTDAVQSQFLGKGPFILSGCQVSGPATGATVTAGIVCLDGQLVRFGGASGVALPAQLQVAAAVFSDPRPYQTAGTRYCMREVPAELVASNQAYTLGEFLLVDFWGGKTWTHVQRASVRYLDEVIPMASVTMADFDAAGLAQPGTKLWGWALCDGQNSRADLRGQFVAGLDTRRTDYDMPGKTGGAESVTLDTTQLPAHSHKEGFHITDGGSSFPFKAAHNSGTNNNGMNDHIYTEDTGGGQAHENRPPFYVLAMLQWVGY